MIVVLTNGIIYGLVLAMLIGPAFFALIRVSIDKGFWSGAFFALGVALSDAFAAFTVYFGISQFTENEIFQTTLGIVGGFSILLFGLYPFLQSNSKKNFLSSHQVKRVQGIRYIFEGILLTLINPLVYIFWLGAVSYLTVTFDYTFQEILIFFLGTFATVLSADLIKVYISHRITRYLTPQIISTIDRVAGICLMAFGVRLLVFAFMGI